MLTLQVGRSFYPLPAYLSAEVGVNNRIGGFSAEVLYTAELGQPSGAAVTAIVRLRGGEPLKNGDGAVIGGIGGLYTNDQGFLAYGTELLWAPWPSCGISNSLTAAAPPACGIPSQRRRSRWGCAPGGEGVLRRPHGAEPRHISIPAVSC